MNYPKSIVIAAALIAGAIVFSVRAQANPAIVPGSFQIATARPDSRYPAAWIVDTRTGDLTFCIGMLGVRRPRFIGVNCFDKKGKMLSGSWGDMKTK
jgi:hypothetical protein